MKSKGFTLIELLVVVAIIGILATVVLSSLGSARTKAQLAAKTQELTQIKTALELYNLDNNDYPPDGCLGRASGSCFGGLFSGSTELSNFSEYIDLEEFSSTSQLEKDAFVYVETSVPLGECSNNKIPGRYILWSPDHTEQPGAGDCGTTSQRSCCPASTGCGTVGSFCAYPLE